MEEKASQPPFTFRSIWRSGSWIPAASLKASASRSPFSSPTSRALTTLIEDLDPEDADLRLRPALDAMIDAVHRYEGTINRVQGDGIMALFGAPLAHEDNAVRAAYAALEMQKAVRAACEADIAIRVGLHAGEVLVRAIHNDLSVDYDAIGPTVHLAARMEQMAPPGAIYCTANVMRLAEGFVDARPLGQDSVKGIRQPIDLFEIVGHGAARTRWEVTAAKGLAPFVGRESELAQLRQALELAASGHGQLVAVQGEAGTGKSRLLHEFLRSPQLSGWTVLKTAAAAYRRGTPYLAISNLLRSWCEIPEAGFSRRNGPPPAGGSRRITGRLGDLFSGLAVAAGASGRGFRLVVAGAGCASDDQSKSSTGVRQRLQGRKIGRRACR